MAKHHPKDHKAVHGLKAAHSHSAVPPAIAAAKQKPSTDPTKGLKDSLKATQVAALARQLAELGGQS